MNSQQIQQLWNEFNVPENIRLHMKKVAQLCSKIAEALKSRGVKVNKENLINAALIHDTLRAADLKVGHSEAICKILEEKGRQDLSNIIGTHDFLKIDQLKSWEQKILYYADKRVEKDKTVTLKKRFEIGKIRNFDPKVDSKKVTDTEQKVYQLEQEFIQIVGEDKFNKIFND